MEKVLALTLTKDSVDVLYKAVNLLRNNKLANKENTASVDKVMECMDTALLWFDSEGE